MKKIDEKKICFIGPSLKMGGAERASVNMANSLFRLGESVTMLTIFNHKPFFDLDDGIPYYCPPDFNKTKLSLFKTIIWIRRTVLDIQPEVVLVYSKLYAAITSLALCFTGIPIFISERSSPLFRWGPAFSLFNKIIFFFLPPKGIIAQTSLAAEFQKKYYSKKSIVTVIPNALRHVELFPNINREKTILAVGRFNDALKGFDRLVEAYSLINNYKGWKLQFAGGDEDGDYLKQQARELGILENIIFFGKVINIDQTYASSGIFVIPSRSEGFPNALCEAMAAGLPCVAFDFTAGPRDIITPEEDGYIVKDGDIKAMAEQIQYLIDNENERQRIGKNAMKIRERYNQIKIAEKVVAFLQNQSNS